MYKLSKAFLAGLLAMTAAGCATAGPPEPSAQALYYNTSTKAVVNALAGVCMAHNTSIESQTDNILVCAADGSTMEQVLLSNSAGATPRDTIRFNVVEVKPGTVKATGQTWVETQNAFGGSKRTVIDNDRSRRGIKGYMNEAATALGAN